MFCRLFMSAPCGSLEAIKDSRRHESKLSEVRRQSEYWERPPPRHNSNPDTWYLLNTLPDIFSTLFCLPTIFHKVSYTHFQIRLHLLFYLNIQAASELKMSRSKFWCIFVMDQYLGAGECWSYKRGAAQCPELPPHDSFLFRWSHQTVQRRFSSFSHILPCYSWISSLFAHFLPY